MRTFYDSCNLIVQLKYSSVLRLVIDKGIVDTFKITLGYVKYSSLFGEVISEDVIIAF